MSSAYKVRSEGSVDICCALTSVYSGALKSRTGFQGSGLSFTSGFTSPLLMISGFLHRGEELGAKSRFALEGSPTREGLSKEFRASTSAVCEDIGPVEVGLPESGNVKVIMIGASVTVAD